MYERGVDAVLCVCMVALRAVLRILPHPETGGDGRTGRLRVVTAALGNAWAPRKDLDGNALSGIWYNHDT